MSDMSELFARDPLNHTRESIDEIIDYYRKARAAFNLGEKSAGSTKKAKAGVAPGPKAAKLSTLDLDDILNKKD